MKVLLINPPVYDVRLPWAQFQEPTTLLRLATYLKQQQQDVKLIDALHLSRRQRLTRTKIGVIDVDDTKLNKWRFGLSIDKMLTTLRGFAASKWYPDKVYVECFTTFWWQGAAETISTIKAVFPNTVVILLGTYASLASKHARQHSGADVVLAQPQFDEKEVVGGLSVAEQSELLAVPWNTLFDLPSDPLLYPDMPQVSYLSLGGGRRTADEVVEDIIRLVVDSKRKLRSFAFVEHEIITQFTDLYRQVLEEIIRRKCNIALHAFGTVTPAELVMHTEMAGLMGQAGYVQIHFADDRHVPMDATAIEEWLDNCRIAAALCHQAGYPLRSEAISASLSLGRINEDLSERARTATLAAHYVGSIIFWPYQPSLAECHTIPLEDQNAKLFPLRKCNNMTYRDYAEVLGLATVLNAKYRTATFDFLGGGLMARFFRDSVAREAWEPDADIKGSLQLPMIKR